MEKDHYVLLVDDDPTYLEIMAEHLEGECYRLDKANDGAEAWKLLEASPEKYDAVLLDRIMPNMGGMEVLAKMKGHESLKEVPVILETAQDAKQEIQEGLEAGAYYYLTKPFEKRTLIAIVRTAVSDCAKKRALRADLQTTLGSFSLLQKGVYNLRTLKEADILSTLLAKDCPNPGKVVNGVSELLINAVEHGNLSITYDEKSVLIENGELNAEVEQRLNMPEYSRKVVTLDFERKENEIRFLIKDEGDGFNWGPYLKFDPNRAFDTHGRGIAMSKEMSFDRLEYKGNGNEVLAVVKT